MRKKALSWEVLGDPCPWLAVGHFEPGVVRGRLRYISPIAFKVLRVWLFFSKWFFASWLVSSWSLWSRSFLSWSLWSWSRSSLFFPSWTFWSWSFWSWSVWSEKVWSWNVLSFFFEAKVFEVEVWSSWRSFWVVLGVVWRHFGSLLPNHPYGCLLRLFGCVPEGWGTTSP